MYDMKRIVVTDVVGAINVFSPRGTVGRINVRQSYGLSFCREGQITYCMNGSDYISDNRHIIILPQGQSYTLRSDKTGMFPVINFTCTDVISDTFLLFPIHDAEEFMSDFEKIKELILSPENRAKTMSVFDNMLHRLFSEESLYGAVLPAVKHIEKNYADQKISNKSLARECGVSEVYLRKLFIKNLNTTPKKYISEMRLKKAKQLLSEGVLKIGAIAEECGFSSTYNFCRFFKSKTNISPTEYMKRNRVLKI